MSARENLPACACATEGVRSKWSIGSTQTASASTSFSGDGSKCALHPFSYASSSSLTPTLAQVRSLEIHKPRLFGYYIGISFRMRSPLFVDDGALLKDSSLPAPGPLNYWLTLKAIQTVAEPASDGGTRYILKLTYQTFYDPLEPHWLKIPGFQLIFDKPANPFRLRRPNGPSFLRQFAKCRRRKARTICSFNPTSRPMRKSELKRNGVFGAGFAALAFISGACLWPRLAAVPPAPTTSFHRRARRVRNLANKHAGEDAYPKH